MKYAPFWIHDIRKNILYFFLNVIQNCLLSARNSRLTFSISFFLLVLFLLFLFWSFRVRQWLSGIAFEKSSFEELDDVMNCFCGMVDRRKAFCLISTRDQGFKSAQDLSSDLAEWSCAVLNPYLLLLLK